MATMGTVHMSVNSRKDEQTGGSIQWHSENELWQPHSNPEQTAARGGGWHPDLRAAGGM